MKREMRTNVHLMLILTSLILFSCEKDLRLPSGVRQRIVLLGELVAEDSIYLRAGQSSPVQNGGLLNDQLINGLTISVRDAHGLDWTLTGRADDVSGSEFTLAYSSPAVLQAGAAYQITAVHPELGTAECVVAIPGPFTAAVVDTVSQSYNGDDCLRFNIDIVDPAGKNYYVLEVLQQPYLLEPSFLFNSNWWLISEYGQLYDSLISAGVILQERNDTSFQRTFNRLNFYTADNESETLIDGNNSQLSGRLLLDDIHFSQTTHTSSLLIPRNQLGGQFPGIGLRTLIQVKSISEEYFRYLKVYTQGSSSALFNGSTGSYPAGNISNGVGIVGGVFRRQFVYFF